MRFGLLHELPLPRPWEPGAERQAVERLLDLAEVADRAGVDHLWLAEHHFEEERSHLSAPAVLLAAAAQRTERIRLGLANAPVAPQIQHPARAAETVATLDLVSGGRVDLGVGVPASGAALAGFGIDRTRAGDETADALAMIARMLVEEPFTGADAGRTPAMPPRNVVPKPLQQPHPPLWLACTRREYIRRAAERGLGALVLAPLMPHEAAEWTAEYEAVLGSERCVPAGRAVTPRVALVLPLSLHEDAAVACERIADGVQLRGYAQAHFEAFGAHRPGRSSVADGFARRRGALGLDADDVGGAIGTPGQVRELAARYADAGVDQLVFVAQPGGTPHEHARASIRLLGEEVVPAFAPDAERADAAKDERLSASIAAALERRPVPPALDPAYAIGAHDSGGGARVGDHAGPAPDRRPASPRARMQQALAAHGEATFARFVAHADDRRLERTIGSDAGLRVLFGAMARQYVPGSAGGFAGALRYELRRADGAVRAWTIEIDGSRARARASADGGPAPRLTLRLPVADLVRLAAGELEPARAVFTGRLELEGDLDLAPRLGELFGREAAL